MNELAKWRALLGEGTILWSGPDGFKAHETSWVAQSGYPSIEVNSALCWGASDGGVEIQRTIDEILASGIPTIVMVAGEALGDVQVLIEAGWVCVGTLPFVALDLEPFEADPAVRLLVLDELPTARGLLEESFGFTPEIATAALPDTAVHSENQRVWGIFEGDEMATTVAIVRVGDVTVSWSIGTPPRLRGRGYATRLFRTVLGQYAREGATLELAHASKLGEPLHRTLGFRELERWQLWSRPRWSLGRA